MAIALYALLQKLGGTAMRVFVLKGRQEMTAIQTSAHLTAAR